MKIGRCGLCALMVVSLAACGGGGGGNGGGGGTGSGSGSGSGTGTTYTIGGPISGLSASGLVLADNGGDNLTVPSGQTSFTFSTPLQSGATYDVTVATQPTGETCTVASATGTATANVTSVAVTCKPLYTIGGKISGLSASGLVLADNGGDNLSVASGATSFTFATKLLGGATYNVTVATQPTGETCTVASGTGTATANVTSVTVNCAVLTYTISGSISGLSNSGLKLQDYSGGEILPIAANATQFKFVTPVSYGTNVDVTVASQPFWQWCTAGNSNYSGPITSNITSDSFACTAAVASGAAVGTGASFGSPAAVALDSAGDLYVVDTSGNAVYKISAAGAVSTLPFTGLNSAEGVAVNSSGSAVYVANTGANQILELSGGTTTILAQTHTFNSPEGVAVDSSGNVYVADTGNNKVDEISPAGVVTALGGSFIFTAPAGVAVDSSGNVYVTDTSPSNVVEISGGSVTTLPGTYSGPFGIAVDSAGDVYVADTNDFEIKMITAQGNAVTLAGSTTQQGSCAASPPLFTSPYGIAVNASGDLYVSDYALGQVCKLTPGS